MPRGDRRGPDGLGAMTGRGAGYCAGYSLPGFLNSLMGRFRGGYGYGACPRGGGRRRTAFFGPTGYRSFQAPREEEFLAGEADYLRQQLKAVEARLAQLEKGKKESPGGNQD